MIRFIQLTLIGKEFNPVDLYVTPSPEILELFSKVATRNIEAITARTPCTVKQQFPKAIQNHTLNIDINRCGEIISAMWEIDYTRALS